MVIELFVLEAVPLALKSPYARVSFCGRSHVFTYLCAHPISYRTHTSAHTA